MEILNSSSWQLDENAVLMENEERSLVLQEAVFVNTDLSQRIHGLNVNTLFSVERKNAPRNKMHPYCTGSRKPRSCPAPALQRAYDDYMKSHVFMSRFFHCLKVPVLKFKGVLVHSEHEAFELDCSRTVKPESKF
jgi:hypothetical protein